MKIFVDSSILVEYEKQTKVDLLESLFEEGYDLCLNAIVVSEYLFHLIAIRGGKSPLSIAESKQIAETLDGHETTEFLSSITYLTIPQEAVPLAIEWMKLYNLLSNDALILAACKL